MAYLQNKGYESDIFISYSHKDDNDGRGDGIVTAFRKELALEVEKLIGQPVFIWLDNNNLRKNERHETAISDIIRKSAIFISFYSNSYFNSFYCKKEYEWFNAASRGGKITGSGSSLSRFTCITLYNVQRPPEFGLMGTSPYELFDKNDTKVLGPCSIDSLHFRKCVTSVANDIYASMNEIATQKKKKIFIADVTDTLSDLRKQVEKDILLKCNDVMVFPHNPPPFNQLSHYELVTSQLEEADLSIHLLNEYPGKEIYDATPEDIQDHHITYPMSQLQIAHNKSKPRMIFLPKGFKKSSIKNADYYRFVDITREEADKNCEVFEVLDQQIGIEAANKIKTIRNNPVPTGQSSVALLDFHPKDWQVMSAVQEFFQGEQIIIDSSPFSLNANIDLEVGMNLLLEKIKTFKSFLMIFGGVEIDWAKKRIEYMAQRFEDLLKIEAKGIYISPRLKKFDTAEFLVFQKDFGFGIYDDSPNEHLCQTTLRPFADKLRT